MAKQLNKQFIFLNLFRIVYPLTAIVSFLHRASGIIIFLFIPFLLWILTISLKSDRSLAYVEHLLANPLLKFIYWIFFITLGYHIFAGIRHLLLDIGVGKKLTLARGSSIIVISLTIILALVIGTWLW